MLAKLLCRAGPAGMAGTYLMRATDALASTTATYAIPLLVLVTSGSTAHDRLATLAERLTLTVTP